VDGRTAGLGERADPATQRIAVDGRPLALGTHEVTLLLHKPAGVVVTAHDERGRRTVYEVLRLAGAPSPPGLRYVGRLDYDSEGLLLLTTDGALAHRLTHPRYHVPRIYEAALDRLPPARDIERLRRGIMLNDGPAAPADLEVVRREPAVVRITLHEGRNRQVRRMFEAVGARVVRLVRIRLGTLALGRLRPGEVRALTRSELRALRTLVGLEGGRAAAAGDALSSGARAAPRRAR
jgi:pseudouridine synthase